jgi:hypothetical protein
MSYQKCLSYLGALSVVLALELVSRSLVTPRLLAQSLQVSLTFPPTEDVGAPSRTAGAGKRSATCVKEGSIPLTALTPNNNVATTVSANPTLFWYVPETQAESAEFVVVDDRENEIYQTTLALRHTPGVMQLNLPATVKLDAGKDYKWQLALICNPNDRSADEFVQGGLKRIELRADQKTKLAAAKEPLKQAEVYAGAKIWQETLMLLAQLRRDRPNDSKIADAWRELLTSVDLQAIASEPLVECCRADR